MSFRITVLNFALSLLSTGIFAQKNLLDLIPREALFVATLHSASLDEKLSWKNIQEFAIVDELARNGSEMFGLQNSTLIRNLIKNPQDKGINILRNFYGFVETAADKKYLTIAFPLNDPAKFKAMIQEYFGDNFNKTLLTKGEYLALIQNNLCIVWQKDHAFVTYIYVENSPHNNGEDRDAAMESEEIAVEYKTRLYLALDSYIDKICSLSEAKSYSRHGGYNDWEKTVRDAGMWVNSKEIMRLSIENPSNLSIGGSNDFIVGIMDALINSYGEINIGSDVSFEKGKIISKTYGFMGPELMKFAKSATKNTANKKILKYIDGQKSGMYMITAFSPKGVYEGCKEMLSEKAGSMKPSVDDLFGILEIFMDEKDAFNFLKGDFFYAINGAKTIESVENDYEYNENTNEYDLIEKKVKRHIPLAVVGFSYGNKEDMLKFIRIVSRTGFLKEEKKNIYKLFIPMSNESIFVKLDKGLLLISNDEERLLQNKKYRPMSKEHKQNLKKDFQTVYVNPGNLMDIFLSIGQVQDKKLISMVKNIKDGVGEIILHSRRPLKGDKFTIQDFSLDLKNKEENALKQIFDFANRLYLSRLKGI